MHIVYIDDARDEKICVFSALAIPADSWRAAFTSIRGFRKQLRTSDGIFVRKEFHAWKFVSGRGHISDRVVPKSRRCAIFLDTLGVIAALPGARLFNAVFPAREDEKAFEWMLNRIQRSLTAWDSHAILVCDEGKESIYTRLARRMAVFNPIPSAFGKWDDTGNSTKNIPTERILEDPFFKKSERSYFIQLADFCGYALLRRENPLASKTRYGLDKAFNCLAPILVREASRKDPEGIIRP